MSLSIYDKDYKLAGHFVFPILILMACPLIMWFKLVGKCLMTGHYRISDIHKTHQVEEI